MKGNLILILALCFAVLVGYGLHDANVQPAANASTETAIDTLPLPPADVGSTPTTPVVDVSQMIESGSLCPGGQCGVGRSMTIDIERTRAISESSGTVERERGERRLGRVAKAPIKAVGRIIFRR